MPSFTEEKDDAACCAAIRTDISEQIQNEVFIKEFLAKMTSQNCRATAAPFFYVIRDYKKTFIPDENGYGGDSQPYYQYDSILQNYDEYCADCKSNDQNIPSKEEFAELDNIITGYFIEENFHVQNTMFLTEDDAKEHLKANHYHYSNKASTYVMHAWRAPELQQFLNCLIKYFKIEAKNSYDRQ